MSLVKIKNLGSELWHDLLERLDLDALCSLGGSCPFFYKLLRIDFKKLSRTHKMYPRTNETWVEAFKWRNKPVAEWNNDRRVWFTWECSDIISFNGERDFIVRDIFSNLEWIVTPGIVLCKQFKYGLMNNGTTFWCSNNDTTQILDVKTNRFLMEYQKKGGLDCAPHHFSDENGTLFDAFNQTFHKFDIKGNVRLVTGCQDGDKHHYFALRCRKKMLIYDTIGKTTFSLRTKRFKTFEILEKTSSVIFVQKKSYHVYDLVNSSLMLLVKRVLPIKSIGSLGDQLLFNGQTRQVLCFNETTREWKPRDETTPQFRAAYHEFFGSKLMEKVLLPSGQNEFFGVVSYNFKPIPCYKWH